MEYKIINNNPNNFKVTYEINGRTQEARLQAPRTHYDSLVPGIQWVRIQRGVNVTINAYGKVYGDGSQIQYHEMGEDELFQAMTVDRLVDEKLFAAQLLTAWYNNDEQMTDEIFDKLANPVQKKVKGKRKG